MSDKTDLIVSEYAVCPHCGYVDPDSWELGRYQGEDDDGVAECPECGREYAWARRVSYTYETGPVPGAGEGGRVMSGKLHIGDVRLFDAPRADKAQALKVLEEAAEVFAAWQDRDMRRDDWLTWRSRLMEECADVVQAVANLVAAVGGAESFRQHMDLCEQRNRMRGRITGDDDGEETS